MSSEPSEKRVYTYEEVRKRLEEIKGRFSNLPKLPWRIQSFIIKSHDNVEVVEALGANTQQARDILFFILDLPESLEFLFDVVESWRPEPAPTRGRPRKDKKSPKSLPSLS